MTSAISALQVGQQVGRLPASAVSSSQLIRRRIVSRRCPLCNTDIELLLSHVRSEHDFQTHRLYPLPNATASSSRNYSEDNIRRQLHNRPSRYESWASRKASDRLLHRSDVDAATLAIQRRKYVYHHRLYVKHVGSNPSSRFRPFTCAQFASSTEFKERLIRFVRRELMVFPHVDSELCVTSS